MATVEVELTPTTSHTESIITMDQTGAETESGCTTASNFTSTDVTAQFDTAVDAQSIIVMDHDSATTESGLTTDFNFEFESVLVVKLTLSGVISVEFVSFGARGKPIILSTRDDALPWILEDRADAKPVIFHSRGETVRVIAKTDTGMATSYNFVTLDVPHRPLTNHAESIIAMDHGSSKTESGLTTSFTVPIT